MSEKRFKKLQNKLTNSPHDITSSYDTWLSLRRQRNRRETEMQEGVEADVRQL